MIYQKLHLKTTRMNDIFQHHGTSYAEYVEHCKNMIRQTRMDMSDHNAETIITANSPYEWQPSSDSQPRYGALMVHGGLDTPFRLHDMGRFLLAKDCLVRGLLLPGHGTRPGDILNVSYKEWLNAVKYGIDAFENEVEHLYLVGFSLGGLLSLYHAIDHKNISGLILIAPSLRIKNNFTFMANWHKPVSWIYQRAKWFYVAEEDDYARYCSVPFNIPHQVNRLINSFASKYKRKGLNCPVFIVNTEDDETVNPRHIKKFFLAQSHPDSRLLNYGNNKQQDNDVRIIQRPSFYPDAKIINFSHPALPIAPNNSHYGIDGDLTHFVNDNERDPNGIIGAKIPSPRIKYPNMRLSYNPDFDFMMDEIWNFIEKTSAANHA